jgi:hypothetical protein
MYADNSFIKRPGKKDFLIFQDNELKRDLTLQLSPSEYHISPRFIFLLFPKMEIIHYIKLMGQSVSDTGTPGHN